MERRQGRWRMDSGPHPASVRPARRSPVSRRLRWLGASVAALLVSAAATAPAVFGGGAGSIAVSASLAGCERSGDRTTCLVAVSFSSLSGADYYTAKVTRPDGSTQGFGHVGPGFATLPVAYTGSGRYVVTISAWGSGAKRLGAASSR
jgi:hypothetical protein